LNHSLVYYAKLYLTFFSLKATIHIQINDSRGVKAKRFQVLLNKETDRPLLHSPLK